MERALPPPGRGTKATRSQRKPARIRATRLAPAKTHSPGERPWNMDVLHSCKDNNKFMKEKYHKSFHLHSIMFPLSWGLIVLLHLPKMGCISIRSLWKDHLQFHHSLLAKVLHISIWPLINNGWDSDSTDNEDGSWGHSCWVQPDPGGLLKAQVASLPTWRKWGPFWSLHKGSRYSWQGEGKHTYKVHPSFHIEWLRLHQPYLQMQFCYLRLMFWNMMSTHSWSPVLPERSWEQKLRHPSLSKSSNSLLKTCCRQNLQRLFLTVTWKNNEFLF